MTASCKDLGKIVDFEKNAMVVNYCNPSTYFQ